MRRGGRHEGRRLRRASEAGVTRGLRFGSFPVTLTIPWGVCVGPMAFLPYVPLPAKVTVEFGAPIDPAGHADVGSLAGAVQSVMTERLRALYAERRWPVVG